MDPQQFTDINNVYRAIQTLYSTNDNIPYTEKQAASIWLNEFQRSVHAWENADQLLHRKIDLQSCYFGAHTLRTKIQSSFHELPPNAVTSLRDSLLLHVAAITAETDQIIVTQLCLAVAHMVLQANSWADPIGHLLSTFGSDSSHWWPVLEILTLLPEEVHSRKLQLGENRRHQVISNLEAVAPIVLAFLKQCLSACVNGPHDPKVLPAELCSIGLVKCFGSWITMNPECFCSDRSNEVLAFAIMQLREGKCGYKMHSAATDCLCAVIEVVPDIDSSSNNNAIELQTFQMNLHTSILSFEEAYHYGVAEEDQEKILNYCRIFTEYGESMIPYMLRSWRDPHYSIQVINLILICEGHHDYEVAEMTFGFWYRLSEDLYHAHDDSLNAVFRAYAQRLIIALYKHCQIEPDHEGPLTATDEFYEFRKKAAELVQDCIFIVGSMTTFQELGNLLSAETSWDTQEAALFLLYTAAKSIDPTNTAVVKPIVEKVLSWREWRHVCLKLSAVRFLGGMALWLSKNPDDTLEATMNFLVNCLPMPEYSNAAAIALQNVCQQCANTIAGRHMEGLIGLVSEMDRFNVSNDAVVGLLKGVGHVVGILPREQLTHTIRKICWAQIQPLDQLIPNQGPYERGTKADPVFWVDRLAALFRNTTVPSSQGANDVEHPCKVAICEDVWPVLSKVCEKYQADVRVMERVCRCLRFAVRCVGKHSHPFLQPLVIQLVSMYNLHHHSCFLYLGSILVDEYGEETQCIGGLLEMLSAFIQPTFTLLNEPGGLRNHPDTVDDFFRLCTRYLQRCPLALLKSEIITPLIQCATQATMLDHREANASVMKFLFDLVHAARRHKESRDFNDRRNLVRSILTQHAPNLVCTLIHAVIFTLPSYTIPDICELLFELKEVMVEEYPQLLENALKQLPDKTQSGTQAATLEQLQVFHKQGTNCRGVKDLSRAIKDFCRLYR